MPGHVIDTPDIEIQAHVVIAKPTVLLKVGVSQSGTAHRVVIVDLRIVALAATVHEFKSKHLLQVRLYWVSNPCQLRWL